MGEFVKVIRGASHMDLHMLTLRAAARNYLGSGIKQPPKPGNRFRYVGFRCAWYGEPGRDQVGPVVRRATRGRRSERPPGGRRPLRGGVRRAVGPLARPGEGPRLRARAGPLRGDRAAREPAPTGAEGAEDQEPGGLLKASEESPDPIPLAVLHTDVGMERVFVRAPFDPRKAKPKEPVKPGPPETVPGTVPPGTYVVAVGGAGSA